MFKNQRVTAIVIDSADRGETDRLLTVYSKELGKIKVTVKSVRKITSKLYGATGLFNIVEIEFVEGRAIRTMTDYRMVKQLGDIKKSSLKTEIGYNICDTINRFTEEEQKDNRVWLLLRKTMSLLNNGKIGNNPWLTHYQYFFWNLIALLGYGPNTNRCYSCKKTLTAKDMAFNPTNGGIKCEMCLKRLIEKNEVLVTVGAIKVLRLIIEGKRSTIERIRSARKIEEELKKISQLFSTQHFPRQLK